MWNLIPRHIREVVTGQLFVDAQIAIDPNLQRACLVAIAALECAAEFDDDELVVYRIGWENAPLWVEDFDHAYGGVLLLCQSQHCRNWYDIEELAPLTPAADSFLEALR